MTEPTPLNPLVHNSPTHTSGPAGDAIGERVQLPDEELALKPSKEFPRSLTLTLRNISGLMLFASLSTRNVYLGGCGCDLSECYIDITRSECAFLCMRRGATYRVSTSEVARIRAAFPQLRVRETEGSA